MNIPLTIADVNTFRGFAPRFEDFSEFSLWMLYYRDRGDSMSFGKMLAILIEERGITQKELASACSSSPSAISSYVQNDREPDYEMLKKIASYFHVTTDYLLEHNDPALKQDEDSVRSLSRAMTPAQRALWEMQGQQIMKFQLRELENTD